MKKKQKKSVKVRKGGVSHESRAPLTPLNDRVIVKPLSAEEMGTTTASGIIIPIPLKRSLSRAR